MHKILTTSSTSPGHSFPFMVVRGSTSSSKQALLPSEHVRSSWSVNLCQQQVCLFNYRDFNEIFEILSEEIFQTFQNSANKNIEIQELSWQA